MVPMESLFFSFVQHFLSAAHKHHSDNERGLVHCLARLMLSRGSCPHPLWTRQVVYKLLRILPVFNKSNNFTHSLLALVSNKQSQTSNFNHTIFSSHIPTTMQISNIFVSLALIAASASAFPVINKRIAQTTIDSVQPWENACDAANGGGQCCRCPSCRRRSLRTTRFR